MKVILEINAKALEIIQKDGITDNDNKINNVWVAGELFDAIDNAIILPANKRRTAKWIKEKSVYGWDGHSYQCSECGRSIHLDTELEDLSDYPYCHCGCEMEVKDGKA